MDIILASDRGPVEFQLAEGCLGLEPRQSSVTGILHMAAGAIPGRVRWLGASSSHGDRIAVTSGRYGGSLPGIRYEYEPVLIDEWDYRSYYSDAGVRMLWIAHHGLWEELAPCKANRPSIFSFAGPYQSVNCRFAERIASLCSPMSLVLFQDYQLATAPGFLRRFRQRQPIALFMHTPFADVDSLRRLPRFVATSLVQGMLGADLLGFQRRLWAERFMQCCEEIGASVDYEAGMVQYGGRCSWIRCYPVSIEPRSVLSESITDNSLTWARSIDANIRDRCIVRVDRLDPAKNALRGFEAFERLLEQDHSLQGSVHFVACLVPSRSDVPEYKWYGERVWMAVARIWERYPGSLSVYFGSDADRALGALRCYDVLLVNPLADGMNLVAQEGPMVNTKDGVVVLARGAGCADQLPGAVLLEDSRDVESTVQALRSSLNMPLSERRQRATAMRNQIYRRTPHDWLTAQLLDLESICLRSHPTEPWMS